MLFCSIDKVEDFEKAAVYAEGIELRLDLFEKRELDKIKALLQKSPIPVMFTVRKASQSGGFSGSEAEREKLIERLFALHPDFFDLEYDMDLSFLQRMASSYPQVKIISSYHNFEKTPENLSSILASMQRPIFYGYKLATLAHSSLDGLRMLAFVKEEALLQKRIIGICMGEKGQMTRTLGKICGNFIDYASIGSQSLAPGQMPAEELMEVYRYKCIDASTAIYALIGSPISASIGHFVHNKVMRAFDFHAIYVKIDILPDELAEFFLLIKKLGIRGLSVTAPLKEHILFFLDEMSQEAQKIGAVNTVSLSEGKYIGFNTDGKGALDALEVQGLVQGKKIIILGTGGAAKAICWEAFQRGATIVMLSRTSTARALAYSFQRRGLEQMEEEYQLGYDVLINCTPNPLPINPKYIHKDSTIMDINTVPKYTSLLLHAKQKGSTIICGYEMFIRQASLQEEIWFQDKALGQAVFEIISSEVFSALA